MAGYSESPKQSDCASYGDTYGQVPYVVLCAVAIWSTFQESWSSHKWLRKPLVTMCVQLRERITDSDMWSRLGVLTAAFVFNAVQVSTSSKLVFEALQVALK
jgi:hypothetical protein